MGGGVDHSSEEASNDRGAKGWQIVRTQEGNKVSHTAKVK